MPELGIWDPRIINGIVEKFNVPQSLLGSTLVQHQNHPYSVWNYDIVYTGRTLAGMNTPGSAGSIVSRTRKGTIAGPFAYMREKKIFDPTTLEWLRAPGEVASPAGANAEAAVLREMRDMSNRFDKRIEWMIWQMLQGSLQYSGEGVYLDVDYLVDSTHKPTVAVGWDQPNSEPNANVQAWKRLIAHDGMVAAIAFESIIKLVAFLAAGVFVTYWMYDGLGDIFSRAAARPDLAPLFTGVGADGYGGWVTLVALSMAAILFLPRQFQILVVENVDERHLNKAVWLFPLYLLAINIFVLPIALLSGSQNTLRP